MSQTRDPYDWGERASDDLLKGVLTGGAVTGPSWPECDNHHEVQHRDGKPPWCNTCGWNRGAVIAPAAHGLARGTQARHTDGGTD